MRNFINLFSFPLGQRFFSAAQHAPFGFASDFRPRFAPVFERQNSVVAFQYAACSLGEPQFYTYLDNPQSTQRL
ncbi:hypothetical protein L596_006262 [Steinernema carpocapsae]|uniref:Uncharacterized protein n=1 Tax=Steinernema carpocapsae TaxID=34508 RepID=A0A4U8V3B0_STECR|nr:hypothetical protein L596_006262 [Steinernema carpocapsae]